ncbi:MAG: preprotein translocase subunit SecG [Myxococcales bacterium]|nr:preprotein translocase subunit SecG [Myxococcales bacterium]
MTTFITIIFVIVALIMVLTILLQSGKGGGLGSALGGGASQSVFGGAGGADFMSKMTQGFAATFMITAMYLAYASAHAGSDFLASEDEGSEGLFDSDQEINPEGLGPNPLTLPTTEEGKRMQASASASVPAQSQIPEGAVETEEPAPEAPAEEPDVEAVDAGEGDPAADLAGTDGSEADAADADNGANRGDSPDQPRGDSPQGGNDSLQDSPENAPSPSPDSQPG